MKVLILLLFTGSLVLAFQNCGYSPAQLREGSELSSMSTDQASKLILRKNCYSCHNPNKAEGDVNYILDVESLVWSRLVVPGEPELSPLVELVKSGAMPPDAPLSKEESDILEKWVVDLAGDLGSGGSIGGGAGLEPKFSSIAARIFAPKCVECHAGAASRAFWDGTGDFGKRVVAMNPNGSALIQAITTGVGGQRMPQGRAPLSEQEVTAIRQWIQDGALNN